VSKKLFYPCAGKDWKDAFHYFQKEIDEFIFCDLQYKFNFKNLKNFEINHEEFERVSFFIKPFVKIHDHTTNIENIKLIPAEYIQFIKYKTSNIRKKIIFKIQSGQDCLDQFNENEIYVFFHRGDSTGEGGSDLHFFSDKRNSSGAAENLYSKLIKKLAPISYVVSDGSNNEIIERQNLNLKNMTDEQISNEIIGKKNFTYQNFQWFCVKRLNDRYGPTLVWKVVRDNPFKIDKPL
jgi:hypothetical protein